MKILTGLKNTTLNNCIEISLRLLVLFDESDTSMDIQRIIFYDYALIHAADFDKKKNSLSPASPFRKEELYVKTELIKEALNILLKKQLIDVDFKSTGILYKKNQSTSRFLEYCNSQYYLYLKDAAKWVKNYFNNYDAEELRQYFTDVVGKWKSEFSMYGLYNNEALEYAK